MQLNLGSYIPTAMKLMLHTLMQAQPAFWDGNAFAAVIGAIWGATAAWLLMLMYGRASLHRQRAELILKIQRQLQRQFRDMIVLRRAYSELQYLVNGVNRMKATAYGFCEERISLGTYEFLLDYIDMASDFELITDADAEYQSLLVAYREWHQSYHRISQIGSVEEFDFSTGCALKNYTANEMIALKMHADNSSILILTLDRAIELNLKATDVVQSAAHAHRNKSRFYGTPRVKIFSNSVKPLSDLVANDYKAKKFILSSSMEVPFAILVGPAALAIMTNVRIPHVKVEVAGLNSKSFEAVAAKISHEEACKFSSDNLAVCFYWVNGESVVLFDPWLYRKPELLGTVGSLVF